MNPFLDARQMTENQSLCGWIQELWLAMFPAGGWERQKRPVFRERGIKQT